MRSDFGEASGPMRVDGGMTANNRLMQFQADLLGKPLQAPLLAETTSLGTHMYCRYRAGSGG